MSKLIRKRVVTEEFYEEPEDASLGNAEDDEEEMEEAEEAEDEPSLPTPLSPSRRPRR